MYFYLNISATIGFEGIIGSVGTVGIVEVL